MQTSIYYCGDIIFIKNTRFKDSNWIDTKIEGHPFIILKNIEDLTQNIFALKVSRSEKIITNKKEFYYIKPSKNGLKYGGYVDLRYVYFLKISNYIETNKKIQEVQYNEIIQKLNSIQIKRKQIDEGFLKLNGWNGNIKELDYFFKEKSSSINKK